MTPLTVEQLTALVRLVQREREDAIEDPYFAEEVEMWSAILDALERQRVGAGDGES